MNFTLILVAAMLALKFAEWGVEVIASLNERKFGSAAFKALCLWGLAMMIAEVWKAAQ